MALDAQLASARMAQIRQKTTSGFGAFLACGVRSGDYDWLRFLASRSNPLLFTSLARPAGVEPATYGFEVRWGKRAYLRLQKPDPDSQTRDPA